MQIQQVFVANTIVKESDEIVDFTAMTPVLTYLEKVIPDDGLMSCVVDYDDEDIKYIGVDVNLGRMNGKLVFTVSKDRILLPQHEISFVPYLTEEGAPQLLISVPPGRIEKIGMEALEKYYNDHLEFVQVMLGHFALFADLNSKNELKEFIETTRTYH